MITENAPCKINLYLDVLNKRDDGYHNIKSIMQTVSLYDTVSVEKSDRITLTVSDPSLPSDDSNLSFRAAKLFFELSGIGAGAKIHIEKNIPVSSGLAGGSTDAAATLKALNKLYGNPLAEDTLMRESVRLGADVPFCLSGGTALCEGIGEIISPIDSKLHFHAVIARGGEGVSTPAAYKHLDGIYGDGINTEKGNIKAVIDSLTCGKRYAFISNMFNIFEKAVFPTHSCAKSLCEAVKSLGADGAMMSGSGPAVFGFFKDKKSAENAAESIRSMGYLAFVCETV